jgi:beta-xylosidase
MRWADGWPVIGEVGPKPGTGQPVLVHAKPVAGGPVKIPPTSDEFSGPALGLHWQWNANSQPGWYSLTERPGFLRLATQPAPEADYVRSAPAVLLQKLPAPAFVVNTRVRQTGARDGDRAGLILDGMQYAWLGLRKSGAATQLVYTTCTPAMVRCTESTRVVLSSAPDALDLRMEMREGGVARFSYSTDGMAFVPVGEPFTASKGRWVGAQVGLFSAGSRAPTHGAGLEVDYFRVTAH